MILCPGCGADMKFDPASGKLSCSYCNTALTTEEYRNMKKPSPNQKDALEASESEYFDATVFTCPQCGAQLISTDETAATFCSYCGASVVLEGRITKEKRPNKIIPFQVTKDSGLQSYRELLKKNLFIPSEMKSEEHIQKLRGIYMPYWIYTFKSSKAFTLHGQKTYLDDQYKVTDDYSITIQPEAVYEGISYDASSLFYDDLSAGIAPFQVQEAKDFDPGYMSGFYADTGDVDPDTYADQAKHMAATNAAIRIANQFPAASYSIDTRQIEQHLDLEGTAESGYFPVWFLSSRNKDGDRVSYAVINGQSGKITAELPISFSKYLLAAVVFAIPVYILLNLMLTPTPGKMLVGAAIFAFIAIIITFIQIDRIYARETRVDDRGLSSLMPEPGLEESAKEKAVSSESEQKPKGCLPSLLKFFGLGAVAVVIYLGLLMFLASLGSDAAEFVFMIVLLVFPIAAIIAISLFINRGKTKDGKKLPSSPFSSKLKKCWKQLLGLLIILAVLILDPASDLYFYIAAFISMAFTVWGFYDIIKEYNMLTTRKLPQMGKRGGDENA